eukprot:TRINITY_DN66322_c0_g1_i1.p1 TRINITY_DN66322_c0_g1~~TRINITY_DN66322_c0_g1_i1.p1  ORF type:complete len:282 (+),score=49.27 TRINITY_DN66322_c0_g1_i1:45-848(+)
MPKLAEGHDCCVEGRSCSSTQPAGSTEMRAMVSNDDRCAICLELLDNLDWSSVLVTACEHRYCSTCILHWAKSCSQCPVCKQEMGALKEAPVPKNRRRRRQQLQLAAKRQQENEDETAVKTSAGSSRRGRKRTIMVVPRGRRLSLPPEDPELAEAIFDQVCQVCGSGDDGELLLLCDGCDEAYHGFCLLPQILVVPSGEWFCPICQMDLDKAASSTPSIGRPPGRASFLGPGAAAAAAVAEKVHVPATDAQPVKKYRRLRRITSSDD